MRSLVTVALVTAFVAWPYSVPAGTVTGTMHVTATVTKTCTFNTGTLSFGNYDGVSTNATTPVKVTNSATALAISCTKKTTATIALNNGTNGANCSGSATCMSDGSGDYLNYALYTNSTFSTVWNATHTVSYTSTGTGTPALDVNAEIPAGQNASAGNYTDTITATATF